VLLIFVVIRSISVCVIATGSEEVVPRCSYIDVIDVIDSMYKIIKGDKREGF
jgi:hypothetical protein